MRENKQSYQNDLWIILLKIMIFQSYITFTEGTTVENLSNKIKYIDY